MKSIQKRLLRWLLIGQFLAVAMAGVITFFYLRSELESLFDDRLRQLAYSVPSHGNFVIPEEPQLGSLEDEDDDQGIVIQVWDKDGKRLYFLNHYGEVPAPAPEGFSSHWSGGTFWRSFVLQRDARLIQVSQPYSERLELSTGVAIRTIAPVLVLVVVLGVLVWVSVNRGLRPLQKLAGDLGRRRPYSLSPLGTEDLPKEIRPLVEALNDLLERLGHALEGQRQFIADAAHELRTPLTAVQLQVQVMQQTKAEQEREDALTQIRSGVARASHLVHQLLTLARLEPEDWQRPLVSVDLRALVTSVVGDHVPTAVQRQIDLGVDHDEEVTVPGDIEGLRVMLGNLLDNAIRYSPIGSRIDVSLRRVDESARIEVLDRGPGIPAAERSQVFDRFYRRPGMREPGSGLGLAIVREVAARHGGDVSLADGDDGVGLRVIVSLPVGGAGEELPRDGD